MGWLSALWAFVKAIPAWIQDLQSGKDQRIGEQMQQGADLAEAQKNNADMAKAAANAPKTLQELEDEQNAGKV